MMEDEKLKKYFQRISILLFILSLTQKCYCTTTTCSDSIMVFLLGWAAIISGGAGICWVANPLLYVSWMLLKKNLKASMFLAMGATLTSLAFLLFGSISDNEGGVQHQIISYKAGYWLWTGSAICMLIGTFTLMLRHNTRMFKERQLQNHKPPDY